jgi:DNA-directed RNA polymerase specialized sigma24 family protein
VAVDQPDDPEGSAKESFEVFVAETGPMLQRALVAAYGREIGHESAADALAWAWAHWARVDTMRNPAGYLYRVGQTCARRRARAARRAQPTAHIVDHSAIAAVAAVPDVDLGRALAELSQRQRVAVMLVVGYGHTLDDAARSMGCSVSTLRNHLRRALDALRARLTTEDDDA